MSLLKICRKGFIKVFNGFFVGFLIHVYVEENGIDLILEENEQWRKMEIDFWGEMATAVPRTK